MTNKHDDILARISLGHTTIADIDAIKELVAENDRMSTQISELMDAAEFLDAKVEKAQAERDKLRKEVWKWKATATFRDDAALKYKALAAAIERETIERCARAADDFWMKGVPHSEVMDHIRDLPTTADQSALDRIVDERTKELREAVQEVIDYYMANPYMPLSWIRVADALEDLDSALSRTNGKDQTDEA